ncbi:MAG TPA: hypothetical protein VKC61_15245 [Pyrinomonadaceae bacterium]|nr:hypothetical protein [Pyrinomonadaceae bacterium]
MNEENRFTTASKNPDSGQRQPSGKVGLRGCWELLIKVIILLILIAILIAYWFGQIGPFGTRGEYDIWAWLILLLMIALLIYLICRQRHFVMLNCGVTQPAGCKHGNPSLLANHILEPITGTASGLGFSRYTIEIFWNGTTLVPNAVIYANAGGNPDTTLTFGNHQVTSGTLGFVDIQQAVIGAGIGILSSTNFEVRLHVFGIDGSRKDCSSSFQITAAAAYIKYIGGAWAHDIVNPNEPLRVSDTGGATLATVGGGISVRGAANPYGCGSEQISEYSLWVQQDPTFSLAQPATGAAYDPLANSWTNITTVVYTTADQRTFNTLDGMPAPDYLTNQPVWGTRTTWVWVDFGILVPWDVPDLVEFNWGSGPSGKYSFLLKVIDTAGNTYYDLQRAWIDNETLRGKIQTLRYHGSAVDIPACTDVLINDGAKAARSLDIRGFATDPLIIAADLTQPTSDNFDRYTVLFRKQGAAAEVLVKKSATPAPNRATWTGGIGDPPTALLATLDLSWVDAGVAAPNDANGTPVPADNRLARQTSCTYDIILRANDSTIVSEGTNHHIPTGEYTFPVKIVNDLP